MVRASGTVVSAEVSLGYDVDRRDAEAALLRALENTELDNGFVQIRELGDFSVLYRASGWLEEAGLLVSTRSKLRGKMLDALHDAGIEIVSPNFMNQRVLDPAEAIIPVKRRFVPERDETGHAEEVLFNKAEMTSAVEALEGKIKSLKAQLNAEPEEGAEEVDRDAVKAELSKLTEELEAARLLAKNEAEKDRLASKEEE